MKRQLIINIAARMEAGGAQKAAVQVCEGLIQRGFESEVWFLYKESETYVNRPGVRWLYDERPKKILDVILLCIKLYHWLRNAQPNGVITYTHYANVIGQTVAYLAGIPYRMATQRNPSWSYPTIARWLDRWLGTIGIYTSNIFVSHSVADSFQSYPSTYNNRSRVVLNGLAKPGVQCTKLAARAKFGLPVDRIIVTNVGRLAAQKNQQLLIKAIGCIPRPNWYLVIAGDGELRCELEQMILEYGCTDHVKLLGEISPEEIGDLLIASDIFVFPSRFEAFGFATVEAMMMGLPVIASDLDVNREIIGDAGIFLPIKNPQEWSNAIQLLVNDEQKRKKMGDLSLINAQRYDVNLMIDQYIKCLFTRQ
jgi:glycosyltransferase involved in cell wall biosynthesis